MEFAGRFVRVKKDLRAPHARRCCPLVPRIIATRVNPRVIPLIVPRVIPLIIPRVIPRIIYRAREKVQPMLRLQSQRPHFLRKTEQEEHSKKGNQLKQEGPP